LHFSNAPNDAMKVIYIAENKLDSLMRELRKLLNKLVQMFSILK